jgi:hypothetical protein
MADHVYSLVLTSNIGGQFASSVNHWIFDDSAFSTTQEAAKSLITAWLLANKTRWTNIHPTDTTLLSVRSRLVQAGGGFEAVTLVTSGGAGTRSGTTSVAALSPVVISFEQLNGPRRGRTFLHGVSETDCVDGVMSSGFKSAVNTNIALINSTLTLVGGGGPHADFVIYDRVARIGFKADNHRISDMIGTIRRRQIPA